MQGSKPVHVNIVAREFRGSQLFLVRVTRAPKGYRWTNERAKALRFSLDDATALAREASRDYGALCAVQDIHGALVMPACATHSDAPPYHSPNRATILDAQRAGGKLGAMRKGFTTDMQS